MALGVGRWALGVGLWASGVGLRAWCFRFEVSGFGFLVSSRVSGMASGLNSGKVSVKV